MAKDARVHDLKVFCKRYDKAKSLEDTLILFLINHFSKQELGIPVSELSGRLKEARHNALA